MSDLGKWLEQQIDQRQMTQGQVAVYSGVSQATISDIINKQHVPRVDLLFKLADYFNVSRPFILRLVGYVDEPPGFNGLDPELKAVVYELLDRWDSIAKLDPSGESLRQLLTVVTTQAAAFEAAMRSTQRESPKVR